jgi:hypothetical protein
MYALPSKFFYSPRLQALYGLTRDEFRVVLILKAKVYFS